MKALNIKPINCYGCPSCYEAKIPKQPWDIEKVMITLRTFERKRRESLSNEAVKNLDHFTIHGGEPLLLKYNDLLQLLKYSYWLYGRSGIQTNLLYLEDRHIELFKRYNTCVGVSIDGDTGKMNQGRFPGNIPLKEKYRITRDIIKKIKLLTKEKISVSIIALIRNYNHLELPIFIQKLKKIGIKSINLNPCIVYNKDRILKEQVSNRDLFNLYKKIYQDLTPDIRILPINNIIDGMVGLTGNLNCSFKKCDPWAAIAEITLKGDGSIGTCLHTGAALDGIQSLRAEEQTFERYDILKSIKQIDSGCHDCSFWYMCRGGCSGAGINNNWLNKTRFCEAYKKFFNYIYDDIKGKFPNIYLTPDYFPEKPDRKNIIESTMGSTWAQWAKAPIKINNKKINKKWNSIIVDKDTVHDDSNSQEWRDKNPGWDKERQNEL